MTSVYRSYLDAVKQGSTPQADRGSSSSIGQSTSVGVSQQNGGMGDRTESASPSASSSSSSMEEGTFEADLEAERELELHGVQQQRPTVTPRQQANSCSAPKSTATKNGTPSSQTTPLQQSSTSIPRHEAIHRAPTSVATKAPSPNSELNHSHTHSAAKKKKKRDHRSLAEDGAASSSSAAAAASGSATIRKEQSTSRSESSSKPTQKQSRAASNHKTANRQHSSAQAPKASNLQNSHKSAASAAGLAALGESSMWGGLRRRWRTASARMNEGERKPPGQMQCVVGMRGAVKPRSMPLREPAHPLTAAIAAASSRTDHVARRSSSRVLRCSTHGTAP